MKCCIPEISWHNRDPVLSVDVQKRLADNQEFWRLATGGSDSHVLIWHLTLKTDDSGEIALRCVADLERHQKAVNVVRFSPSGELLASGDDESAIVLWRKKADPETARSLLDDRVPNEEHWVSWKVLRGHLEDVYDLSWSPDSTGIVSGSVDNTAILWDVKTGRSTHIFSDYKGFVQGVSWDPQGKNIVTLSSDRQIRLVDVESKRLLQKVSKAEIPKPRKKENQQPEQKTEKHLSRLFHDDTFKSFFRRLTYSADGSLIIAPSGIIESTETSERLSNSTIVFSRNTLRTPLIVLPSLDECTIAVRCNPICFELRKDGPTPMVDLPYRMVFAVISQKSVFIYDTQQTCPIAVITNIHYTRLTDVTWSSNGEILVVSSTDGYCSIITFQHDELGKVYKKPEVQKEEVKPKAKAKVAKEGFFALFSNVKTAEKKSTDPMVITTSADKPPTPTVPNTTTTSSQVPIVEPTTPSTSASTTQTPKPQQSPQPSIQVKPKTPRRVQLITLSSPKRNKTG